MCARHWPAHASPVRMHPIGLSRPRARRETTHVVVGCEEGAEGAFRARRRSRALSGILSGCYVLSHMWAEASIAAGSWVEEGPYLLPVGVDSGCLSAIPSRRSAKWIPTCVKS